MIIIPAIDLRNGKCVRLVQGDANRETVYSNDPVDVAEQFKASGAEWLHVIDLDGAFSGERRHTKTVREIVDATGLQVELGGGVRELEDIEACLAAGASRVILGTSAHTKSGFMKDAVNRFGDAVAVGIDSREGKVAVRGWTEMTETSIVELAQKAVDAGVRTVIHTDIAVDGTLAGPDIKTISALMAGFDINIIASGGIASLDHIRALLEMSPHPPAGCITGKAIYAGTLNLKDAISIARSS